MQGCITSRQKLNILATLIFLGSLFKYNNRGGGELYFSASIIIIGSYITISGIYCSFKGRHSPWFHNLVAEKIVFSPTRSLQSLLNFCHVILVWFAITFSFVRLVVCANTKLYDWYHIR